MKFLALSALVVFVGSIASAGTGDTGSAIVSISLCKKQIARLESEVKQAQDRFNIGEVTRTDVSQAKLGLLNKRLTCNTVLIHDYCSEALDAATTVVNGVAEEVKIGQLSAVDANQAANALDEITARCE